MEEVALALQEELGDKVSARCQPDLACTAAVASLVFTLSSALCVRCVSPDLPDLSNAKLFIPPTPILRESNWPLLEVKKGFFERLDEEPLEDRPVDGEGERRYVDSGDEGEDGEEEETDVLGWGDSKQDDLGAGEKDGKRKGAAAASAAKDEEAAGPGWGDDLDLELPEGAEPAAEKDDAAAAASASSFFVMPLPGKNPLSRWSSSSSLAPDLIAAGAFDLGMHLLNRQLGIVNFAPLKEHFLSLSNSIVAYLPSLPSAPAVPVYLHRSYSTERDGKEADGPALCYQFSQLGEPLKAANKSVTGGKFQQALKEFLSLLQLLPFVVVEQRAQVADMLEFINLCREYVLAIRIELRRKESTELQTQALLAAYFTQCRIQPIHLVLGLRSAIKLTNSVKAFGFCAHLCRRLLELCVSNTNPAIEEKAEPRKIRTYLAMCEKQAAQAVAAGGSADAVVIPWPEDGGFSVCGLSFTAVERGKGVKCPFCVAVYKPEYAGQLCNICGVAKIGAEGTGLRCFPE